MNLSRIPLTALAFILPVVSVLAADALDLSNNGRSALFIDETAPAKVCIAGDISDASGRLSSVRVEDLEPARYRAVFFLRLSHPASRHTAFTRINLSASSDGNVIASRELSVIAFDKPGVYQAFALPFDVSQRGAKVVFSVSWGWESQRTVHPVPLVNPPVLDEMDVKGSPAGLEDLRLERYLSEYPYHLALGGLELECLGSITLNGLEVDKIRYKPNEEMTGSVRVHNYREKPVQLDFVGELIQGMEGITEFTRGKITVPARGNIDVDFSGSVGPALWGREVRVRVEDNGADLAKASGYFTVHTNMWAVMIGAYGINLPRYRAGPDGANAESMAQDMKDLYFNCVEFVFWAPDDMCDLTPGDGRYWSGQMRRDSSGESTRWLINAFHDAGIACSFYTRIRVGGGKAAYDLYREHPDWFDPQFYDVRHLDRWDESHNLISWPRVAARTDIDAPFLRHAEEIIQSIDMFAWDAARYDSRDTDPFAPGIFPLARKVVDKARPAFQWGYNDGLNRTDLSDKPELRELFDFLCSDGALMMDEYNTHAFKDKWTFERYARRHVMFRDNVHSRDGHLVFCPSDVTMANDAVFQAILPMAARASRMGSPERKISIR